MKKIVYLLVAMVLISGCKKDEKEDGIVKFNYEESFKVIKEVLDCEDKRVRYILEDLENVKIKGVVSFEITEEEKSSVIAEIKSEDGKEYRLYMTKNFSVQGIQDMETEKFLYRVVM